MKRILIVICIIALSVTGFYFSSCSKASTGNTDNPDFIPPDSLVGVFEGKIHCADCQQTKVRLTLYGNKDNSRGYLLERVYVGKGNDVTKTSGSWTISKGINIDPDAVVFQLDSNSPAEFGSYYLVDNNLLLFLDENKNLKVGDAAHSYTLSRTK